ncbi:class I SAM-dependent methyltransferase [Mediterraneibacter faecis]|uniref:class I SAM-dependent methyltransferase n=1 Tax=Mediterraneibacter faecis TaxID=592978 RepID=UPI0032C1081E
MEEIIQFLAGILNREFIRAVFSNPRVKDNVVKAKLRPMEQKGELLFQLESFTKTQVFHKNLTVEETKDELAKLLEEFRQVQVETVSEDITVLISKKGKATIKRKRKKVQAKAADLSHNRKKKYILEEGIAVPFLQDLGVMTQDGKIVRTKMDKFRQINRFLEFVEDILPQLDKDRELTLLDFGCGKSYLTFAMYYYLHELKGYDIRIIGLDLKTDVILHCNELAKKYGYEKLTFLVGDIADYEGVDQVDMVVTLHACDTATDYALAKAVGWNAKVILSVPCCQHEVNKQLEKQRNLHSGKMKSKTEVMGVSEMLGDQLASMEEVLGPIMDYGLLRERFAALVTDGLRAKRLESEEYETQVLEFIDMEHTPKNILLRAVKKGSPAAKSRKEAEDCERFLKIQPTLGMLLAEQKGDK